MYLVGYLTPLLLLAFFLARWISRRPRMAGKNESLRFWLPFVVFFVVFAVLAAQGAKK